MDKIEKIKEWVKKQKKEELARNSIGVITGQAFFVDANELLSFLDTLSEEPDKSLEEAAGEQAKLFGYMSQDVEFKENVESFIAGAEWQASQMPMPEDTVLFQKGVTEGRRLEREDMMKDSVTVECYVRVYHTLDDKPRPWVALYKNGIGCNSIRDIPELENIGFKDNDTAIVIIKRKEDGQ